MIARTLLIINSRDYSVEFIRDNIKSHSAEVLTETDDSRTNAKR